MSAEEEASRLLNKNLIRATKEALMHGRQTSCVLRALFGFLPLLIGI